MSTKVEAVLEKIGMKNDIWAIFMLLFSLVGYCRVGFCAFL